MTVGADKNYDTAAFVVDARALTVTPHVAQNITARRGSNIDARTTRHEGYRISLVIRKRIEEANGWIKQVGGMAQTKFRGLDRVGWMFTIKVAAYDLIRLPRLLATGWVRPEFAKGRISGFEGRENRSDITRKIENLPSKLKCPEMERNFSAAC